MTFRGIEPELILVALVPSELDVRVAIVSEHKADSLSLADDTVSDVELILSFVRKAFKSHRFFIACSNEPHLVLLVHVVQRSEGEQEFVLLSCLRSVADVESIVGFLSDGVRQTATFKCEAVVGDGIEADCGWHLSLIL